MSLWHRVNLGRDEEAWCNGHEIVVGPLPGEQAESVHDGPVSVMCGDDIVHCDGDWAFDCDQSGYVMCDGCASLADDDEFVLCEHCETAYCRSCSVICGTCGRQFCDSHAILCRGCDTRRCIDCGSCPDCGECRRCGVETRHVQECGDCGNMFCQQCMDMPHDNCPLPPDETESIDGLVPGA